MKATELLKAQHQEVEKLFKRVLKAKDPKERTEIFEELAANIVGHDAIEREIFYPACEEKMGMTKLLGEALVEHGAVEFSLFIADQARDSADFEHKVTVLKEMIEHHVEEEEQELFPKVEKALGSELLGELGADMERLFEQSKEEDFRAPLQENLRQVLGGAKKTRPGNGAKHKPAKRTAEAKSAHRSRVRDARPAAQTSQRRSSSTTR